LFRVCSKIHQSKCRGLLVILLTENQKKQRRCWKQCCRRYRRF